MNKKFKKQIKYPKNVKLNSNYFIVNYLTNNIKNLYLYYYNKVGNITQIVNSIIRINLHNCKIKIIKQSLKLNFIVVN